VHIVDIDAVGSCIGAVITKITYDYDMKPEVSIFLVLLSIVLTKLYREMNSLR
jgi:hypothetical protein